MVVLEPHQASRVQALLGLVAEAVLLMERVLLEQEAQAAAVQAEGLVNPQLLGL